MNQFSNPLWEGADPYVIQFKDHYLWTHCDGNNKIYISKSDTLIERGDMELVYEFPKGQWNSSMVWGPAALFKWSDDKWYIYYCAADGSDMDVNNINHRLGVLQSVSDDPMGPYKDLTHECPLNSGDAWAIAAHPFEDFNGSWYIVWSGLENNDSFFPQCTFIAPMENPWTIGERVKISSPEFRWEKSVQAVQEGHTVFQLNNKLIMLYSANASWTDHYALGMLTYEGGNILDPESWVKHQEPLLFSSDKVFGPAAASIVKSKDGKEDWIVYHTAQWSGSGWRRYINAKKFSWDTFGNPEFGEPVPFGVPVQLPSGDLGIGLTENYKCTWNSKSRFDWTTYGGDWTVEGGGKGRKYVLKSPNEEAKSIAKSINYDNLDLECYVNVSDTNSYSDAGIIFRASEPYIDEYGFNGYYVAISAYSNQISLLKVLGNSYEVLDSANTEIKRFKDYLIRIKAIDSCIKIYLDDTENPIIEAEDNTYLMGSIGVMAHEQSAKWKCLKSERVN